MSFVNRAAAIAAIALTAMFVGAAPAEAKLFKAAKAEAEAKAFEAAMAEGPVMTMLASSTTVFAANAGPCCEPACPVPCIKYRNAILDFCKVRCCNPCAPPVKAVLHAKNPCTCCPVDVPVCLPSCCCGEPKVCCKPTLFGSGVITYTWCCGVEVNVRFDKCGDVLVTYRGT